ncbi:hypothetical protein RclHR1_17560001 [Rhizophagus clarus]|uniref:Protein kinase domain-containing protein n=1 Tax=Rhizophagus clarus TaxID=94130 RepID=A0A2Z6QXQ0_9GLOM|nr:hypothetical protein RclHR1_17560001 [Rhizophagus clarus]
MVRVGSHGVVLKRLENVENANQNWLEEVSRTHLTISNKWSEVVACYGLTQDPSNGDYMLVMNIMNMDLRKYIQQNHNQLTWKEKVQIAVDIILALSRIHDENAIHRDLHSGNMLLKDNKFSISDLGFCGPAGKPLKSIYGNLPYIAPEVIIGKEQTFKSDIYSIAMLMWEISSGQPPFINYEHDYYLAMNIVNGIRPKTVPGTLLKYKNLMKRCWDADPSERPNIKTLRKNIRELNLFYQSKSDDLLTQSDENNNLEINNVGSLKHYTRSTSRIHQFENLPEPRNATEAFYSNSYDFYIPNNIDDFGQKSCILINEDDNENLSRVFNELSETNIQNNDYREETMQQQMKNIYIDDDGDEDEVYNNPNLHPGEQDELELPNDI